MRWIRIMMLDREWDFDILSRSGEKGTEHKANVWGSTEEAGFILHLDRKLFFLGEIEEGLSLSDDIFNQSGRNVCVFDIEKSDIEESGAEGGEESGFGFGRFGEREVEDGDFGEGHGINGLSLVLSTLSIPFLEGR